jgi:hypothetical protein
MMNNYEQRVREFAYQIWESEGRPSGNEYRHWEMACKLADSQMDDELKEMGSGHVASIIGPDEPFNPDPKPEIDPAPLQPDLPTPPAHPNIPPRTAPSPTQPSVPAEPIAPVEEPPHISPTPQSDPIQPTDPVQPGNPAQPIQPTAKRAATVRTSVINQDGKASSANTKPRKSRSVKSTTLAQDSMSL